MKQVDCHGTPYEIGNHHGNATKSEISRGLKFYTNLFEKKTGLSWSEVCAVAERFNDVLQKDWPRYCQEMQGVADGAGVPYLSILALNVRTEIAYGMSQDGCTAVYWRANQVAYLAQNWDWEEEQKENLISINISQVGKPAISMITEAGIIGKIGLNSKGVGVCLNAIQALGVDFGRLPCHLALRTCLESETAEQAVATLQKAGVASACHILVADENGAIGLECTSVDIVQLPSKGVLTHTNHLIKPHPGVEDKIALKDSPVRLERINHLIEQVQEGNDSFIPGFATIHALLADEKNFPTAICRARTKESSVATLFSIVMDLKEKTAEGSMGRPSQADADILQLNPSIRR